MKNGFGIMLYKNLNIYEGYWKNDKKDGYGIDKFVNGCLFYGYY
jgi:hypothetical protein